MSRGANQLLRRLGVLGAVGAMLGVANATTAAENAYRKMMSGKFTNNDLITVMGAVANSGTPGATRIVVELANAYK